MERVREYLRHANECLAIAARAINPEVRSDLEALAKKWRQLATERERYLRSFVRQRRALARTEARTEYRAARAARLCIVQLVNHESAKATPLSVSSPSLVLKIVGVQQSSVNGSNGVGHLSPFRQRPTTTTEADHH